MQAQIDDSQVLDMIQWRQSELNLLSRQGIVFRFKKPRKPELAIIPKIEKIGLEH